MLDFFRFNTRYEPLDQVNLMFRGKESKSLLSKVLSVLDDDGWGQGIQQNLYLLDQTGMLRSETDWRTLGPIWNRFHVRLWSWTDAVAAAAHKERLRLVPIGHEVESFDAGKRKIEDIFCAAGWTVHTDHLIVAGATYSIADPAADGSISVIISPILVDSFQMATVETGQTLGQINWNGFATQITVSYLRDGSMVIIGLPADLPSPLHITQDGIFTETPGVPVADPQAVSFLGLYRIWDPRAILQAGLEQESVPPMPEQGVWSARCHTHKLSQDVSIFEDRAYIASELHFQFVTDGKRIRQIIHQDFSRSPARISVQFTYLVLPGRRSYIA